MKQSVMNVMGEIIVRKDLDLVIPWKPFYDEDATFGIYRMKTSPYDRNETQYIFYVNPDYPDGWWENHTL